MTQKERQEHSRREIYRAALEEFGTNGYDQVNMERICANHGISKGMMYHYYSSKDQLFLLCVERTFSDLKAYVEQHMAELDGQDALESIKGYFLLRERYFERNPWQKAVFEHAMLRPPRSLADQIQQLRAPIQETNREFMRRLVQRMPLRPGLEPDKVIRHLEGIGTFFQNAMAYYCQGGKKGPDLHTMLEHAGEMLDLFLYGVLRQTPETCPEREIRTGRPAPQPDESIEKKEIL
ncbi:TetR/AcrR family transcriptional regulator [uncultured Oscillibacter sp.]|uniref:TetR/AcrR family transcriptional regulator n=1 Tax=uncultured Oscillibacter sp. TaxID=876091 RepID=UPI0028061BBF|nr:TetR/AcrR family transcriptional regulator [uncultured Oscillibacter sp.]